MQSTTFGRLCIKHRIDLRKTYPCPKKGEHYNEVLPLIAEYINDGILNVKNDEKQKAFDAWEKLQTFQVKSEIEESEDNEENL